MNNDKSNSVKAQATMETEKADAAFHHLCRSITSTTTEAEKVFLERLSMIPEDEMDEVLRRIAARVANAKQGAMRMSA